MEPANIQYLVIYFWNIPWVSEIPKTVPKLPGGTLGIHAWDNLLVLGSSGFSVTWVTSWQVCLLWRRRRAATCSKANGKRNALRTNCARACVCYEVCPDDLRRRRCSPRTHTPPSGNQQQRFPIHPRKTRPLPAATDPSAEIFQWQVPTPGAVWARDRAWTLITANLETLRSLALQ